MKLNIFRKYFITFDIESFFDSLKKQSDFNSESLNLYKFYNNYKDNELIIIPKLYYNSNNFIIMKFEEGTFFDNSSISEYNKYKIMSLYQITLRNDLFINKFINTDLHDGNWKVRYDEKTKNYKLILYDFGICKKIDDNTLNYLNIYF